MLFHIVRSISRVATFSPRGETGYETLPDRFEHWEIKYGVRTMKRGNKYFEFLFGKTKDSLKRRRAERKTKTVKEIIKLLDHF